MTMGFSLDSKAGSCQFRVNCDGFLGCILVPECQF